jgi:repressor LexA
MADDGQCLAALREYYAQHGVLPSYAGIGKLVGLRSKASVAELVTRLKDDGFLGASPDRRLKPGPHFFERTVAESVRAGMPAAASDITSDAVSIDRFLIPHPSRTVLITVKGDSMMGAGILEGDVVIVEKRPTANVGDIVVAILENEFTVKRLAREKGRVVLRPENKAYPIIRPKGDIEIFGVVVGQFRSYRPSHW